MAAPTVSTWSRLLGRVDVTLSGRGRRATVAGNLLSATCKLCFLRREILWIVKLTTHVTIGVALMVMTSVEHLRARLRTTVSYLVLVDSVGKRSRRGTNPISRLTWL
jgi:hypothetical protein